MSELVPSTKEDNSCDCLLYYTLSPFWKGVYSEKNRIYSQGEQSLSF